MRKFFVLFALGCLSTALSAQVSGYQGQRMTVGYNASAFLFFTDYSSVDEMIFSSKLAYKNEVTVNYTLNRKVNFGMSYAFATQHYIDHQTMYVNSNMGYHCEYVMKEALATKLNIVEIHFQIFNKNFIAPAGLYHQFGFGIVNYNLNDKKGDFHLYAVDNSCKDTLTYSTAPINFSGFKLSYQFGKTNPIGHKFYINSAIAFNYFTGGDLPKISHYELSESSCLLSELNKSIKRHNLIEIKIGLGWFAF